MQSVKIIVAMDSRHGISKHGSLPWHISDDFRRFRKLTMGGDIIMGSTTFKTLKKPLPGRHNIVLTRHHYDEATCYPSLKSALRDYPNAWLIGGGQAYSEALQSADELFITHILHDYECDAFFPEYADSFAQDSRSVIMNDGDIAYYYAHYTRR